MKSCIFVQDDDPSQNSKVAKAAMKSCIFLLHQIPARSPDLNPIENVFHIVKKDLQTDTVEVMRRTLNFAIEQRG